MSDIREETLVKQRTTVGKKCDVCGKESIDYKEYNDWFYGSYQHHDWGKTDFVIDLTGIITEIIS
jgi:hypothetical protein